MTFVQMVRAFKLPKIECHYTSTPSKEFLQPSSFSQLLRIAVQIFHLQRTMEARCKHSRGLPMFIDYLRISRVDRILIGLLACSFAITVHRQNIPIFISSLRSLLQFSLISLCATLLFRQIELHFLRLQNISVLNRFRKVLCHVLDQYFAILLVSLTKVLTILFH